MKQRRLISMMLTLVLMLSVLAAGVPVYASTVPSLWAVSEMNDANTAGLLTANAAKDFQRALTRDEFCELVVLMAERMLGRELQIPATNPFTDSSSLYVQKAYYYGVIFGVGDNKFDPNSKVERQQLCAMMVRAIKKLETDTGKSYLQQGSTLPFYDSSNIDLYAVDPVKQAYASGIMLGDDTGNFNPKSPITAEQCVAVIIRTFNKMQKTYSEGRTDSQIVEMAYNRLHIGFAYGDTENGVTRDIVLPTVGACDATISWSSGNENVISTDGEVNAGTSPVTVTLTATIKSGTVTREKVFTLTTSPFSGERLLLENAYNELEVIYLKSGDGPNSVTGRISLPSSVLSMPVSWRTSNASAITTDGVVTTPSNTSVVTVTLTATIMGESSTKQKAFELRVNNPSFANRSISLYGVELGMTQTQVAQVLGSAKRSIQVSSSEVWNTYHADYKNFVAVAFQNNITVGIYSSASDASEKLRDATNSTLTVAQANGFDGVNAIAFTDSGNSSRDYAIMIYRPSSAIRSSRSLYATGLEELLLELINAFRNRNNSAPLVWNNYLGIAARNHTNDMINYNYLDTTSRSGQSLKDRATAQGYETKLVSGGNVLGGPMDAVDCLQSMVNTAAVRSDIISNNNTVFGAGFQTGGTGQYKTYITYITGTLRGITAITSNPATVSVAAGKKQNVTLVTTPSNANGTIRWHSSNTSIMTLSGTEGAKSVTVTGVSAGYANIVVTCVSSGKTYTVPVTVSETYATALSLKYGNTAIEENEDPAKDTSRLFMLSGETLQLTSATTPAAGPAVTWRSNNTNIATVSSTGLITAKSIGAVTITATTSKSSTENIVKSVTINVSAIAMKNADDKIITGVTLIKDTTSVVIAELNPPESSDFAVYEYEWSTGDKNVVTLFPTDKPAVSLKGVESGKTVITLVVKKKTDAGTVMVGSFTKKLDVEVTGSKYAESLKLLVPRNEITVNQSMTIGTVIEPVTVEKNTITWYSFDKTIADVNQDGIVTGKKKGTTTIYASMEQEYGGKLIEEFQIEVKEPDVMPTKIEIYISDGKTNVSVDDTIKLAVKFTPTNVTNANVTWTATNDAEVSETGEVTFKKTGPVMVTATSTANGVTAVMFFDVK